jgi:RNA polymerase sigma factor (sigma-70 family)
MISIGFSGLRIVNNKKKKVKLIDIFKKIFNSKENKSKDDKLNGLIKEYQKTRNEDVFAQIYKIYEPIILNMSKGKDEVNINYESELNLALFNAVLNYDTENRTNATFKTYFIKCAKNQVNVINLGLNAQKRKSMKGCLSMQSNNKINEKGEELTLENVIEDVSAANSFQEIERNAVLDTVMSLLRDDEKKAVTLIMQGYTLKEIGEKLGNISAPAIHSKLKRLANNSVIAANIASLRYC